MIKLMINDSTGLLVCTVKVKTLIALPQLYYNFDVFLDSPSPGFPSIVCFATKLGLHFCVTFACLLAAVHMCENVCISTTEV